MVEKYLNQLREVQALIRTNKANLAKLEMPKIEECNLCRLSDPFFTALRHGVTVDINRIASGMLKEDRKNFYKYLRDLGEYLINFTDYYAKAEVYDAELIKLEEKERDLKSKLGIV